MVNTIMFNLEFWFVKFICKDFIIFIKIIL